MPDTIRDYKENIACADCGNKGTEYYHWGPLVPLGQRLHLCQSCFTKREEYYRKHGKALEKTYMYALHEVGIGNAVKNYLQEQQLSVISTRVLKIIIEGYIFGLLNMYCIQRRIVRFGRSSSDSILITTDLTSDPHFTIKVDEEIMEEALLAVKKYMEKP